MNQVDCRGRVQAIAKKVAKPPSVTAGLMTDTTPLSARYAPRWYVKRALYDGADRNVLSTTGATSQELQRAAIQGETSAVTTTFSKRGLVVSVGGSYGPLVTGVIKDADGLTQKLVYGDLAKTETVFTYDQRRRVRTVQTYRGPPSCWKVGQLDDPPPECKGYAAGEFYLSNDPTTFPLLLEDTEFTYDHVDNPIELRDWRLPHEWPAGAKPVSKKAEYDDLYRLKRLDYVYAAGKDGWTSPFAHEDAKAAQGGEVGIGEKPPVNALPRQSFDDRLLWQTYRYDWLGNSVSSDDDAHGFYDRSLGAIKNGTATAGPYQLKEASNETAGKKPREGRLTAKYDEAGYLTDLAVNRSATGLCLPANKPCNHRFRYDWDEVGRLAMARRWDASTTVTANDALPTETAAVTLRHTYDGGDMRTVKEATSCASGALSGLCAPTTTHSVYVFDSLDLRRAYFTAATGEADYEATAETEAAYLVANGVRLARLHHAPTLPVVDGDGLHVLLELADHLGSGAIVLDKATSELAERMTYQGYGSVESDYRPGRWGAFREDYRFTGKEEDSEVGLTYFGFRYLNTALGRWVSADPLTVHGAGADLNAYAYVHGAVLKAIDPIGLDLLNWLDSKVGPSSAIGQKIAHGDYFGSSLIQDDQKLKLAQDIAVAVAIGSATVATGGAAGNAAATAVTSLGSSTATSAAAGAASGVVGGAVFRGGTEAYKHRSVTAGIRAASDPKAIVTDAVWGAGTGVAIQVAAQGVRRVVSAVNEARSPARAVPAATDGIAKGPSCNGGVCKGTSCFVAGTSVLTEHGLCAIEHILPGDKVWSRDPNTGKETWKSVKQVYRRSSSNVLRITLRVSISLSILDTTQDHPFWVDGTGWVQVGSLSVGDLIQTSERNVLAEIISIKSLRESVYVYNLNIEDFHTYFVGQHRLWVHNADYDPLFSNQLKADFTGEKQIADIFNVKPQSAGSTGFATMINGLKSAINDKLKFVLTEAGELRVVPKEVTDGPFKAQIKHSIAAGGPDVKVYAAGEIWYDPKLNGYVINNSSGHYLPNSNSLDIAAEVFEKAGVSIAQKVPR